MDRLGRARYLDGVSASVRLPKENSKQIFTTSYNNKQINNYLQEAEKIRLTTRGD